MKVDLEDLLDAHEVAQELGLTSSRTVASYRHRYRDTDTPFPDPVLKKGSGYLWLRQDIRRWARATGRRS